MDIRIDSPAIEIHPRRLVWLKVGAGRHLTNVRGTAWITVDGDPQDVILEPGDSHTFAQSGRAVVQALGGDAELVAEEGIAVEPSPNRPSAFGRLLAAGRFLRKQS